GTRGSEAGRECQIRFTSVLVIAGIDSDVILAVVIGILRSRVCQWTEIARPTVRWLDHRSGRSARLPALDCENVHSCPRDDPCRATLQISAAPAWSAVSRRRAGLSRASRTAFFDPLGGEAHAACISPR